MFKVLHDIQTGEITKIDLEGDELTEFFAKEKLAKDAAAKEAKELEAIEAIKAAEKAALLAKLGITEDEAKLLLS